MILFLFFYINKVFFFIIFGRRGKGDCLYLVVKMEGEIEGCMCGYLYLVSYLLE